jgi:colanic acid/amylovoran biosynthesis glycosyltransferase
MLPVQDREWVNRYKALFRQGDCFLVEGPHMKKSLMKLGCPDNKIIVQRLGVDFRKIRFEPRHPDDGGTIRVLIVAHFGEKKGIPYALEAIGIVNQTHPELSLKLTIIGDSGGRPSTEKEKKRILEIIKKRELEKDVTLLGFQPYTVVLEEMYKHHIFLAPSFHASDGDAEGGAPVSIIEASASGMPVLSTRHCDIPEVVLDGHSGYLVDEKDVCGLAERLVLLAKNPESWGRMGLIGWNHVARTYDIDVQSRKLEEIYDRFLRDDAERHNE